MFPRTCGEIAECLPASSRRCGITVRYRSSASPATVLLMPAWGDLSAAEDARKCYLGVKVVPVYPGNAARRKPSVVGSYLLMDRTTGEPLAVVDGLALTQWRTAAEHRRLPATGWRVMKRVSRSGSDIPFFGGLRGS